MTSTATSSVAKAPPSPADVLRILCAADAGYAPQLCTMLVSLLAHQPPGREIEIYILATGMPEVERRRIEDGLQAEFPRSRRLLHWLSPAQDALRGLHISHHVNLETYSRLLAPAVLPAEIDRILYLDADMIIVADLGPLYDRPFDGHAVLAAREVEVGTVSDKYGIFNYESLGIPADQPYFNAGVLLMNLRQWREEKLSDRIFEYLRTHGNAVHSWDQGGMNAILHDRWGEIHPQWNQTRAILYPEIWVEKGLTMEDWRRAKNEPKIIHYTGPAKPWRRGIRRPGYSYFFHYLKKTPYRNLYPSPVAERVLGYNLYFAIWHFLRGFYVMFRKKPGHAAAS
jgi:lipopolysaccharide biosynthesis glycosyltransferase